MLWTAAISKLLTAAAPRLFGVLEQKIASASQVSLLEERTKDVDQRLTRHEEAARLSSLVEIEGTAICFNEFLCSSEFDSFLLDSLVLVEAPSPNVQLQIPNLARILLEFEVTKDPTIASLMASDLAIVSGEISKITWADSLEVGFTTPQEVATCVNRQLIADIGKSLGDQLNRLTTLSKEGFRDYREFKAKYASSVARSIKYIRHPSLENLISFDDLCVPPNLILRAAKATQEREAVLSPQDALRVSYRSVILGNPGAGKSTFAAKLCYDLWNDPRGAKFGPKNVVPVLIVLREYAAQVKEQPQSFVEYVEARCRIDFQFTAPLHAFERMCLTAETVVIFDGLDELLDTADRKVITQAVESFSAEYPAVPILVTSRERGYEQAPLDPERFSVFTFYHLTRAK